MDFHNPFSTTREWDPETQLYYYRARYYDAGAGRFLQIDPIGTTGGVNLYTYADNNPLNYTDPFGLDVWPGPIHTPQPDTQTRILSSGRRKWKCVAKCPVEKIKPDACCPQYTYGTGYGPTPAIVCKIAKYIASNSTPDGCKTKHCSYKVYKIL